MVIKNYLIIRGMTFSGKKEATAHTIREIVIIKEVPSHTRGKINNKKLCRNIQERK